MASKTKPVGDGGITIKTEYDSNDVICFGTGDFPVRTRDRF